MDMLWVHENNNTIKKAGCQITDAHVSNRKRIVALFVFKNYQVIKSGNRRFKVKEKRFAVMNTKLLCDHDGRVGVSHLYVI